MRTRTYQMCTRCIMDTSDPEIRFDANGVCNHCTTALRRLRSEVPAPPQRGQMLRELVAKIKREGEGKKHDCIIGVSGGVDSTTVACYVKRLGLRPLAVHFDNGWDSQVAVANVESALKALDIERFTYTVDWEEFRDLQLSFMRASVANCEAPSDHAVTALLFRTAAREDVRFILSGSNLATEAIMPLAWGHYNQDLRQLRAIHDRFGSVPLRTMPTISVPQYLYYVFVRRIRQIPFLNYVDYDRVRAKELLSRELGWQDYGGKHCESVWTRFFQGYYLPAKFGYDKRRAHLSSLICSGQITRKEALAEMETPPYSDGLLGADMQYVLEKLRLTGDEFSEIMRTPGRKATDYPSNTLVFRRLAPLRDAFRRIATHA